MHGHDLPRAGQALMAIQFFGLDTGGGGTVAPSGSTTFGFQAGRPNGNTQLASRYTCTSP
jgi:hypothetical protein